MLVALLIVVALVALSVFIVPQQKAYVIERLGKFNRIAQAGLRFRIPLIENIVARIDLRIRQSSLHIDAKTRDNVTINMNVDVQYKVDTNRDDGVYRAFYTLADPVAQMQSYIADALRSSIPKYTLDEVFDRKDDIAHDVQGIIAATMIDYGYVVVSTLITRIELPTDVERAMNDINAAQRKQEAAQALAEAERIRVVTEARAQAEAAEQAGIGIANQRRAIAEGINASLSEIKESGLTQSEANLMFLFTQWTDMMSAFGKEGTSTVVLPSDFRETAGMFESMLVGSSVANPVNSASPIAKTPKAPTEK